MELRQLRYFVACASSGSFLKASAKVHISQPALGHQIAMLESEIGAQLFVRSSRGLALTEAGATFLEHAMIVLSDVERARDSVNELTSTPKGRVSLGLPATVSLRSTLAVLSTCRERFPGIHLKVVEAHSGYLREWLQTGRVDVALLFDGSVDATLQKYSLLRDKLAFICNQPASSLPKTMKLGQLVKYPLVLPDTDHDLRRIIDAACAAQRISLNVVAEIDSLGIVKRAVEAGVGATILPFSAVTEEVEAGRLSAVPIASTEMSREVVVATSATRPVTVATRAVARLFREIAHDLVSAERWPAEWMAAAEQSLDE